LEASVPDYEGPYVHVRIIDHQADPTPLLFRLQRKVSVSEGTTIAGELAPKDPVWLQPTSVLCPCQRIQVYPFLYNPKGLRLSVRSATSTRLRFAVTAANDPDADPYGIDEAFFSGSSEPALGASNESVLLLPPGFAYNVFAYVGLPKDSPPLAAPVHFDFTVTAQAEPAL
jgi:hypothetical protein